MKAALLKQKLHDYVETADKKKLEAIYTILESEIEEDSWWNDKEFVAEMNRREQSVLNGTAKTYTFEEVFERIEKRIKKPITVK